MRILAAPLTIGGGHRLLKSLPNSRLLLGGLCGLYVFGWWQPVVANFGTSLPIAASFGLALALGVDLGWRGGISAGQASSWKTERNRAMALTQRAALHFALGIWTILFPWLIESAIWSFGRFAPETVASPRVGWPVLCIVAGLLIGLPSTLLSRLVRNHFLYGNGVGQDAPLAGPGIGGQTTCSPRFLCGVAGGIVIAVFFVSPSFGVHGCGFAAVLASSGLLLHCLFAATCSPKRETDPLQSETDSQNESQTAHSDTEADYAPKPRPRATGRIGHRVLFVGAVGCIGAGCAFAERVLQQLTIGTAYVVYMQWAAIMLGAAIGWTWTSRRLRRTGFVGAINGSSCLLASTCAAGLLAVFPLLVSAQLTLNANVSHVGLLMCLRSLLVAVVFAPFGAAWGGVAAAGAAVSFLGPAQAIDQRNAKFGRLALMRGGIHLRSLHVSAMAIGYFVARWAMPWQWGVANLLVGTAWLCALLAIAQVLTSHNRRGRLIATLTAAVLVIAAAPLMSKNYDPRRSTKLLFSTNVFVAKRSGLDERLLPFLDEGRHVAQFEGPRGTFTVWKYRGVQYHLRESGVPKAVVSDSPEICPHFSAAVAQALLPLTLHDHPRRVLLLGLGGGVPLTTCLSFPVLELTCAEPDATLHELVENTIWNEMRPDPLSDERLRLLPLEPTIAVSCRDEQYDVIISNPDQAALLRSTPYYTLEFYRRSARMLRQDGIFCQRFAHVDFGVEPLQVAARTMQRVFRRVTAVETAPGELLLLGSNSPRGMLRDGLVERLHAPHVRRLLSQLGWDWSVPLNLPVYDHELLAQSGEQAGVDVNSGANGNFAFRLPQEVMRWGAKQQELRSMLAQHVQRFLDWHEIDGDKPEIAQRLSEVAGQRKLMIRHTDQPWSYRKALRKRLSDGVGAALRQVSAQVPEGKLHPVDKHRRDYFVALGAAVNKRRPDEAHILRLVEFTNPYDPLISYFAHHEAARLYSRTEPHKVRAELAHRLHAAYYADPRSRSVRNAVRALLLLAEHPKAVANAAQRWDHMNALMQLLKSRWDNRGQASPGSTQFALNDIEKSIAALEAAFECMDRLHAELPVAESDWQARRKILEMALVRPLRTYRSRILPRHRKQQQRGNTLLGGDESGRD